MNAIMQLHSQYVLLKLGIANITPCIDWAIKRLQLDEEGDDLEVVLLAAANDSEEALPLIEIVLERYIGLASIDYEFLAGKYIAGLHSRYLAGEESIQSIDAILTKLSYKIDYPSWFVMLSRNCEYATDVEDFREPFEQEFEYISNLWDSANSRSEFEASYSREVSNSHDFK
ncbi:hypothetical protein [Undibacterium pigrum]|uniref:Uncharacterized protein n=1 Tax=Undibacterium pigrum TaxID=401470 RepID=A0A318IXU1_9BURK|nr:hypothetical protein [Undibacterium pigrum]PXX40289.1 hypothetical protein DFR42_108123 [Undibacterium pigrum]